MTPPVPSPAVRRGRRRVLPLATVRDWHPCADQHRKVATLADDNGDIPLTRTTLRKALALNLDWGFLASRLGVDTAEPRRAYDSARAEANRAYRAALAEANRAFGAALAEANRVYNAALAEACFRKLLEGP